MPRGKKAVQVELLPPEDDQSLRGRKRLVEAEHTIKYSAPVPVTVEDDPAEDNSADDLDFVEEEKAKRRRKTAKDERDDFRRELDKLGVASVSRLKLSIDKYRHSDSDDSGTLAEKDYCTKYPVTKEHILNDDYMDVARRYGSGRFWFTLRMDNKIVRQWERQVNQAVTPSGPVIQGVNPNDPNSPQVIIQSDGQQVMPSIKDIMKGQREALKEHLEMTKLMREAYGFAPEQSTQPKSEEEVLTTAILKQPEVIENVVGSVLKRFGGSSGKDDEPWYADVVRDAVKSGQAAQIVQVAIDRIFNGFQGLFPGRQNNGQAQISQTPLQNQETTDEQISLLQTQQQSDASYSQGAPEGHGSTELPQGVQGQQTTPEEQTLAIVLNNCSRKVPPQITADQVLKYADLLNDQAPQYSIDGYLEMFAKMPIEAALEFVKTQPNGEQIANLEWAKNYTEQLQKLIQDSLQEGEE